MSIAPDPHQRSASSVPRKPRGKFTARIASTRVFTHPRVKLDRSPLSATHPLYHRLHPESRPSFAEKAHLSQTTGPPPCCNSLEARRRFNAAACSRDRSLGRRSPFSLMAIRQSAITHRRQAVVRDIPKRQHTCFHDRLLARAHRSFASSALSRANQLSASSILLIAAGDGRGSLIGSGSWPTRSWTGSVMGPSSPARPPVPRRCRAT